MFGIYIKKINNRKHHEWEKKSSKCKKTVKKCKLNLINLLKKKSAPKSLLKLFPSPKNF